MTHLLLKIATIVPAYIPGALVELDSSLFSHREALVDTKGSQFDELVVFLTQPSGILLMTGAAISCVLFCCLGALIALAIQKRRRRVALHVDSPQHFPVDVNEVTLRERSLGGTLSTIFSTPTPRHLLSISLLTYHRRPTQSARTRHVTTPPLATQRASAMRFQHDISHARR